MTGCPPRIVCSALGAWTAFWCVRGSLSVWACKCLIHSKGERNTRQILSIFKNNNHFVCFVCLSACFLTHTMMWVHRGSTVAILFLYAHSSICVRVCVVYVQYMSQCVRPSSFMCMRPQLVLKAILLFHRSSFDSLTLDSFDHDSMISFGATSHVTRYSITFSRGIVSDTSQVLKTLKSEFKKFYSCWLSNRDAKLQSAHTKDGSDYRARPLAHVWGPCACVALSLCLAYICKYTYTYARKIHIHVCTYTYIYTYYIHIHICTYVHINLYTFIHL